MTRRIPSLNWLRVFEAAARTGSFARAAERLAMSPPAVSQQIRALEAHLGRALFDRAPAGVVLTDAGRSLLAVVGDALGRMEMAAEAISGPARPTVVIGASLMFSIGWLAPRLSKFLDANPEINIQMNTMVGRPELPPREALQWIAFGPSLPGTDAISLFGERLSPVAHPDLSNRIETVDDLLGHTLIEVADHRRNWAQVLSVDFLPTDCRVVYVDTTLSAFAIASTRGGIALARPPATDMLIGKYGLVPCLPGFELRGVEEYHLTCTSGARLDPANQAFRDWMLAEAAITREAQQIHSGI